jgi:endonuclease/exonuclease/phosphatase family metal-dependent hydrolase
MRKTLPTLVAAVALLAAPIITIAPAQAALDPGGVQRAMLTHTAGEHSESLASASGSTARRHPARRFRGGFTIASLNALGASHTAPGGEKARGWSSSGIRTRRAVRLLRGHSVDVVGLQEFQRTQQREFRRIAGGTYDFFSGSRRVTDNAVAWRRSWFRLVSAHMIRIPYFHGHEKPMPIVQLRVRATGQRLFVTSFHNPANVHGPAARFRAEAARRQVALTKKLGASGLPVLVTGDMNDRRRYFCKMTHGTDMHSFFGGSHVGRCRPPAYHRIDWIFGNRFVRFAHPVEVRSAAVRRTTDHPLVLARVHYVAR